MSGICKVSVKDQKRHSRRSEAVCQGVRDFSGNLREKLRGEKRKGKGNGNDITKERAHEARVRGTESPGSMGGEAGDPLARTPAFFHPHDAEPVGEVDMKYIVSKSEVAAIQENS